MKKNSSIVNICTSSQGLARKGEIDHAINNLVGGIQKYPHCSLFYRSIAWILFGEKRFSEAIQTIDAIPENSRDSDFDHEAIWDCQSLKSYALFYAG